MEYYRSLMDHGFIRPASSNDILLVHTGHPACPHVMAHVDPNLFDEPYIIQYGADRLNARLFTATKLKVSEPIRDMEES